MNHITKLFLIVAVGTLLAMHSALVANVASDPAPSLASVPPHLAKPAPTVAVNTPPSLERGVFIRPLENIALLGENDFKVLPHISHIDITVDGGPRRQMVLVYHLEPGPHKVLIELTDLAQKVVASETVDLVLPKSRDGFQLATPAAKK